jgi:hypothetical protein
LHKLQHPESYDQPPDWSPHIQFIFANNPSTVHERECINCIELFLEEIILRAATLWQGVLYVYSHVFPNAYFIKLIEQDLTLTLSKTHTWTKTMLHQISMHSFGGDYRRFWPNIERGYTFGNLDKIWEDIAVDLLDSTQIITNFCHWADRNLHAFGCSKIQ